MEALLEAIERASFLQQVPGESRQKLRAACNRMKQLKERAAAGAASGAERSPHCKAEYSAGEFDELATKYEKLNWRMVSKPGGATVKPDDFYRLYGLNQQRPFLDTLTRYRFVKLFWEFLPSALYKDTREVQPAKP
eukprot:gene17952-24356_t